MLASAEVVAGLSRALAVIDVSARLALVDCLRSSTPFAERTRAAANGLPPVAEHGALMLAASQHGGFGNQSGEVIGHIRDCANYSAGQL